jgi:hypothetical protein
MFKKMTAFLLMAILGLGLVPKAEAEPKPQSVPAWLVGTYISHAGETKIEFIHDVAEALKNWAEDTRTEACGPIAVKPDGSYIVVLTTQKSQIMCVISVVAPDGAKLTGDSIHDHPTFLDKSGVRLTDDDHNALEAVGDTAMADCSAHHRTCWVNAEPADFSNDDYAGGHGYLVSMGRLLYQNGKDTSTVVNAAL